MLRPFFPLNRAFSVYQLISKADISVYVRKIDISLAEFGLERMVFYLQIFQDLFAGHLKGDSFPAFETDAKIGFLPEFQ